MIMAFIIILKQKGAEMNRDLHRGQILLGTKNYSKPLSIMKLK